MTHLSMDALVSLRERGRSPATPRPASIWKGVSTAGRSWSGCISGSPG